MARPLLQPILRDRVNTYRCFLGGEFAGSIQGTSPYFYVTILAYALIAMLLAIRLRHILPKGEWEATNNLVGQRETLRRQKRPPHPDGLFVPWLI